MHYERISADNWHEHIGHVYRYKLAATWLLKNERVLDIASGVGYGAKVMQSITPARYLGIDRVPGDAAFQEFGAFWGGLDIEQWEPGFLEWDVSVCFETLEHVHNPARLAKTLMRASRLIVCSTPTRPTCHFNPFHVHDFTVQDVLDMFSGCRLVHVEDQPDELSHIFVFNTAR
jgi:2-polyprenyl-3-methyl-5-hydroxy-6-metoxy-1,4-benzoquinol methylase